MVTSFLQMTPLILQMFNSVWEMAFTRSTWQLRDLHELCMHVPTTTESIQNSTPDPFNDCCHEMNPVMNRVLTCRRGWAGKVHRRARWEDQPRPRLARSQTLQLRVYKSRALSALVSFLSLILLYTRLSTPSISTSNSNASTMSTPANVTADLTSKIAALLAKEKGIFTVNGSLPMSSDREFAASSQLTQCSPITIRWDPTS